MKNINREHLGRKCTVLAATFGVAFLCGWSATGLVSGIAFALAIGAGVAVAVFSDNRTDCLRPSLHRRSGRRRR